MSSDYSSHPPTRSADLSTQFDDLSISADSPSSSRPATGSNKRQSLSSIGLLQDESMNLLAGVGGEGEDLTLLQGGDDSFFGNEQDDHAGEEQTIRLPSASGEQEGLRKSRNEGFEFGGSMATSTSSGRPYDNTSTREATRPSSAQGHLKEQMRRAGEAEEDETAEETEELLVLEDESCSPEDKERIKQLRRERQELRGMNKVLRDVVTSLKITELNMNNLQNATNTSHELLDLYSRILSQAEHTKDLILDPDWNGLEADEQYLFDKQQALEQEQERLRFEEEERQRRLEEEEEENRRKKELEEAAAERRRNAASSGATTGRGGGTGRGLVRGGTTGGRVLVRGTRARPTTITSTTSTRGNGRIPTSSNHSDTSSSSFSSGIPTFTSSAGRGSASVSGVRGVRGIRSRGGTSGIGRGRGV
ncbi:DASH complex subunit DUO1 [Sporobolomyces salmoneus]|uniref:DASH complex subunit DUO1 n=1 Tax=Sporobolomyces salmoneus TaxID=183962 RepID=UPI00318153BE